MTEQQDTVEASVPDGAEDFVDRAGRDIGRFGFFFDFDGTLAPIQPDPDTVRPVPGARAMLAALAERAGRTAIVSARPAAFLASRFGGVPGLQLFGLYGLEYSADGGESVTTLPAAAPYAPLIAQIVAEARAAFPGALIEDKRLACALHFRTAPQLESEIEHWARGQAAERGLRLQHGRMVVELKPPVDADKGTVITAAADGLAGAWFTGDDLGDLPAFEALERIAAERPGFEAVRVAVANTEGRGAALGEHADVRLPAPERVPGLLAAVLAAAADSSRGLPNVRS